MERTAVQTAGAVVSLSRRRARPDCPVRMRCINSIPGVVFAALPKRLKPSMTFVLDLTLRWSFIRAWHMSRVARSMKSTV